MSFFDYPIYKIPHESTIEVIPVNGLLTIIVRENNFGINEKALLEKILASVGQSLDTAQLSQLPENINCRIEMADMASLDHISLPLVMIFGLSPSECSLQIDNSFYQLIKISSKNYLFSHALSDLANMNDAKRALWMSLKKYFKKD